MPRIRYLAADHRAPPLPATWPSTPDALAREQDRLALLAPGPWTPPPGKLRVGACAVVFGRAGRDDTAWAAAVVEEAGEVLASSTHVAGIDAPFHPGQLALREGAVLEAAVRHLARRPDVLLVAAAGRDHPRRAGLALHLGAVLDLPTVGVTDDPLLATGDEPAAAWGSEAPLRLVGETVAYRVRTRGGAKPGDRARELRPRPLARADSDSPPPRARAARCWALTPTAREGRPWAPHTSA